MTLTQVLNIFRKVFTFKQFVQLAEMAHKMAVLSAERQSDQQLTVLFHSGHVWMINATDNARMVKPGLVMDEGYHWAEQMGEL